MGDRKKVLMISVDGLDIGGVQTVMMSIIKELNEEIEFDVVSFRTDKNFYRDEIERQGKVYDLPLCFAPSGIKWLIYTFWGTFKMYFGIRKIIRDNGPFIAVHSHSENGVCLVAAAHEGIQNRIVHSHLANAPMREQNLIRRTYYKFCAGLINKYATLKFACSHMAGKELYKTEDFIVINNAIDLQKFHTEKTHHKEADAKGISFINIGRFTYQKNQLFVIDVFHKIQQKRENDRLILVGYGEDEDKIKRYIKEMELNEKIMLLPGDADIPSVLKKADLMIFPSRYEGLGIVLIEAQAAGLTCFASTMVPQEADVGGTFFIDLEEGSGKWAERIMEYIEKHGGDKHTYDLSAFDIRNIAREYKNYYLYGINLDMGE